MAGLDTRGIVDGAVRGFGLMDTYYNRQAQNERADKRLGMQEETFEMQKEQHGREQTKEKATFVLGKIAQGVEPTEDEYSFLKEHPQFWPALDPRTDKSIEVAQSVINPDSPSGPNDPEAIDAMNQLWGHRINRGEGGKKRIAGLYPGQQPGTVALDLEVEREDGTKYNAPMTRNRGVEGDDEILQTPVGDLVEQVQGYRMLRNVFRTPEAQATASRVLAALTGQTPDRTKGINVNGFLVNPETGETMADLRTPEQRGENRYGDPYKHPKLGWVQPGPDGQLKQMDPPGSSDKAPADVKTAEWMVANKIAGNLAEAYALVSTSKSNPASFISRYVSAAQRNQDEFDPNKKSMRELTAEAREVYNEITGLDYGQRPSESKEAPPPEGAQELEIIPPEQEQLPADGSAVQQPDGSYSGRVNRNPEQAPKSPTNPAPVAAVEHLRKNPQLAQQFQDKYGYLPEGF